MEIGHHRAAGVRLVARDGFGEVPGQRDRARTRQRRFPSL